MRTRIFKITLWTAGAFGIFAGYKLSGIPHLEPWKVLNIVGLVYSLLAVFVLSEVLLANANWKKFCVEWLAPLLMWSQIPMYLGNVVGAAIAYLLRRGPSSLTVALFGLGIFGWIAIVGSVIEQFVVKTLLFKDIETRWRWFGLILLASGILFQIIAAIQGL